ncbi:unnamed protein product [Brachionus calyciflorus]|uniref:RING-type domain-containing protein n=1 Tax=Brachionus calyciflorus TaxID=104777 RepID=A0A814IIP9_9BILA|nr:unnamed protein product [Brachionus calyciflorus]
MKTKLDPNVSLLIVGDLNEDLLSEKGTYLVKFMDENNLVNSIKKPTRVRKCSIKDGFKPTVTLLDVCIHNSLDNFGLSLSSDVIGCPFSDNSFSCVSLNVTCEKINEEKIYGRNLCKKNLDQILMNQKNVNFNQALKYNETYRQWGLVKNKFLNIINEIATVKRIKSNRKLKTMYPWYGKDLALVKRTLEKSNVAKEFPDYLIENDNKIENKSVMPDFFNNFFINVSTSSKEKQSDCLTFIAKLKRNIKIITPGFSFKIFDKFDVEKIKKELSLTSSPGVTGIPTRILKKLMKNISPVLTQIFNNCIKTGIIPDEWKTAAVTPLYKNQGSKSDLNNYRGISDSATLKPDPAKIEAHFHYPRPYTQLQTGPLYKLTTKEETITSKNNKLNWNEKCEESFNTIRNLLTSDSVLALPDPNKRFRLDTDTSEASLKILESALQRKQELLRQQLESELRADFDEVTSLFTEEARYKEGLERQVEELSGQNRRVTLQLDEIKSQILIKDRQINELKQQLLVSNQNNQQLQRENASLKSELESKEVVKCSVCLVNPIGQLVFVAYLCGHIICVECKERLVRMNSGCPICQ